MHPERAARPDSASSVALIEAISFVAVSIATRPFCVET
jgi:hypothetical protein